MAPDGSSPSEGGWFDEEAADRICDFFREVLVHVKGPLAGKPFELEPWEAEFLRELFGWKRPDGTRQYRKALLAVPKKNGKSTFAGGLALYMLTADGEEGADVYSAAGDRDQAALVFDIAKRMVEQSPELADRIEVFRRSMLYRDSASRWTVLSADAGTKHGINAHAVIFDELHTQPNRQLFDALEGAGAARAQPLHLYITTAGYDRNSVCFEVWDYARKVLDGVIEDPSFLTRIYESQEEDDWTDPDVWAKANPNLGVSIPRSYLEEQCSKAIASPAAQNAFRRLHLNQWTRQRDRWLDLAKWDACAGDLMPAQIEEAAKGRIAYAGLDLANTTDLAALVLVFPPEDDEGSYDVLCRFWVPEERALERERRDRVPYVAWAREGWILLTEGDVIDHRSIRNEILSLSQRYEIREVAFDRWGSVQISRDLEDEGLAMVAFGQGFASMSAPTNELMRLVLSGRIRHGGHPVLRWNADNLIVKTDPAGNLKPDKAKSTEKIDGMVALVMALDRAVRGEGIEPGSIYATRGFVSV